jgi:hypothetical protein
MKAKVNNLSKNANKYVKPALSKPGVWRHLKPSFHDVSQYEQQVNEQVGNRFPEKSMLPSGKRSVNSAPF